MSLQSSVQAYYKALYNILGQLNHDWQDLKISFNLDALNSHGVSNVMRL